MGARLEEDPRRQPALSDSSSLIRILQSIKPTEIYNLAAQSHVQVSFDVPGYTAEADACVHIMNKVDFAGLKGDGPVVRNCHINIGSGKELTIRALAEMVVAATGFQGELKFDSSKPDGTMRKLTSVSKLHALGWTHKMEIEAGAPALYKWYVDSMA